MERELLRKVQMVQLEIAKEIRRVCEENDIRYFLADGSFLGAFPEGHYQCDHRSFPEGADPGKSGSAEAHGFHQRRITAH